MEKPVDYVVHLAQPTKQRGTGKSFELLCYYYQMLEIVYCSNSLSFSVAICC